MQNYSRFIQRWTQILSILSSRQPGKSKLATILAAIFIAPLASQGAATILINNYDANQPIYELSKNNLASGADVFVEVWGGAVGGPMQPVASTGGGTVFPLSEPGFFDGGLGVIAGLADNSEAQFQIRAWKGAATFAEAPYKAQSEIFTQKTGSYPPPPAFPQPTLLLIPAALVLDVIVPPTASISPNAHNVVAGDNVSFAAQTTGTPPFIYRWFLNGMGIAGANGANLTLNNVNGNLAGIYTVEVSNAGGTAISPGATLNVQSPPVLSPIADQIIDENTPFIYAIGATDPDLPAQKLSFALESGYPAGMSIDPNSGQIFWLPAESQGPNTFTIGVRVSDNGIPVLSTVRNFVITVNEVNALPAIGAIPSQNVDEGTLLSFNATATDSDIPSQTLVFSLDPGAPAGASITSGGLFTWTPTEAQGPGTYVVGIRVNDGVASVSQNVTIHVNEVNVAPVLAAIPDPTVDEGTLLSFTATATDADIPSQTLVFSLDSGAPAGASITSGGLFTWTPTEAQGPGTYVVGIRVNDGAASVSQKVTIHVNEVNAAPVLGAIASQNVDEGALLSFAVTATDDDIPLQTLAFSLEPGAPAGAGITTGGLFTWTPTAAQSQATYNITVRVTDNGSPARNDARSFSVNVARKGTAPTIALSPQSQTIDQGTDVLFSVTAQGSAPLAYQWRFNGADIVGANEGSLSLASVQMESMGRYDVVVRNVYGAVTSDGAQLTILPTVNLSGVGLDGYVANATVFFDANRNGVWDQGEPKTTTDGQGQFDLKVSLSEFDKNHNGKLDPEEGCIVMTGGIDIATGQALKTSMTAPPGSTVVNPLTTLMQEVLDQNPGMTITNAETQVKSSLGLSNEVALTHYDPFASAATNDPMSLPVLKAAAQVQDTKIQITALLDAGSTILTAEEISQKVTEAMVDQIQSHGQLDLASAAVVASVLTQVVDQADTLIDTNAAAGVARIIAESNQLKEEVAQTATNGIAAAQEITRIQVVAQGSTSDDLALVGAKEKAIDDAIIGNTGAGLDSKVLTSPVGDVTGQEIRVGEFSFNQENFRVLEDGQAIVPVTVIRTNGNNGAVELRVAISDGTATLKSGDYHTNGITVLFVDGEIRKTVDMGLVLINDTVVENDETLNLALSLAPGAPAQAKVGAPNSAVVTIVDDDSPGSFAFSAAGFEVLEDGTPLQDVVITRTGGVAGEVTLVVTPGAIAGEAAPGVDYDPTPVTVVFAAGNLNRLVKIPIIRDSLYEKNEQLNLTLAFGPNPPPRAALGAQKTAILTILDDRSMVPQPRNEMPALAAGDVFRWTPAVQQGQKFVLQASTNLVSWNNVSTNIANAKPLEIPSVKARAKEFYRLKLVE